MKKLYKIFLNNLNPLLEAGYTYSKYKDSHIIRDDKGSVFFEGKFFDKDIMLTEYFKDNWDEKFKRSTEILGFTRNKDSYDEINFNKAERLDRYLRLIYSFGSKPYMYTRSYITGRHNTFGEIIFEEDVIKGISHEMEIVEEDGYFYKKDKQPFSSREEALKHYLKYGG